jgi:hypothetical protein
MSRQSIASITELSSGVGRMILPVNRVTSEPAMPHRSSLHRLSVSGSKSSTKDLSSQASLSMMNTSIVHSLLDSQMRVFHRDLDYKLFSGNIGAFDTLDIEPHESLIAEFIAEICSTASVSDNEGFMVQLEILHQGLLHLFSRLEAKKSKGIFKTLQHLGKASLVLNYLGRIFWKIQIEANQKEIVSKIKSEFRPEFIAAVRSSVRSECFKAPSSQSINQPDEFPNILNSTFDSQIYSKENCLAPRLKTLTTQSGSPSSIKLPENATSFLPILIVYVHGFLGTSNDLRSFRSQVFHQVTNTAAKIFSNDGSQRRIETRYSLFTQLFQPGQDK